MKHGRTLNKPVAALSTCCLVHWLPCPLVALDADLFGFVGKTVKDDTTFSRTSIPLSQKQYGKPAEKLCTEYTHNEQMT